MAKNEISHSGRIVEITPELTSVEIVSSPACSGCHARNLCSVSEDQVKIISVPTDPFTEHSVGDQVQVCVKRTLGLKAVWISYVVPLFILMALILAVSATSAGEVVTGLVAIAGVALYYFVIYLLRDRLQTDYVFYLK